MSTATRPGRGNGSAESVAPSGGQTLGGPVTDPRELDGPEGQQQGGQRDGEGLAKFLGWFSIGLGVAQIVAPRRMARLVGARGDTKSRTTMRLLGVREITSGVGILSQPQPAGWVWSRVAGDTMDLALLGNTMSSNESERSRTAAAAAAVLGVGILDTYCAAKLSGNAATARSGASAEAGEQVRKSITVNRPVEEVYGFWRNFENLPRFMTHLEEVRVTGDRRSHWKAKAPAGTTVEWDAETTEDRPNELIAWRSVENADVPNAGVVRFTRAAGGRGTEVHVELRYEPPAGKLGKVVAKLFGEEPSQQVAGDLRRFKQVMEVGEVVHSDASIHKGMHPAQPSAKRPPQLEQETEQQLVVERSADAAANTSSNLDRSSTTARGRDRELRT